MQANITRYASGLTFELDNHALRVFDNDQWGRLVFVYPTPARVVDPLLVTDDAKVYMITEDARCIIIDVMGGRVKEHANIGASNSICHILQCGNDVYAAYFDDRSHHPAVVVELLSIDEVERKFIDCDDETVILLEECDEQPYLCMSNHHSVQRYRISHNGSQVKIDTK